MAGILNENTPGFQVRKFMRKTKNTVSPYLLAFVLFAYLQISNRRDLSARHSDFPGLFFSIYVTNGDIKHP
ncbi:TPA: hypothetical protein DDW35_04650 [Candidatus Sumerlaeota bacterium]|nr:hypothetical protein [Candidatus Sumerlaeota bacterium]